MVIFNSYVKLPEGIPYITGLLHGSNLKVHPSRNQWKEWGTRFSGIGANLWCKSRSIYESNICIYRYIYLFGLIYRWFLSTSNIYIYISYLLASNFSLSLYIYIHIYIYIYIYIYGFKFPLNPVRVKWLCLSSQLSGCSFRQRWPCFSLWDAANNGRISDSEDLVDPKYKTVWGQGFRTDTLGVTNRKAHGCVSEMVKFTVRMFYSENIGTWWWISDFKGLCFPAILTDTELEPQKFSKFWSPYS